MRFAILPLAITLNRKKYKKDLLYQTVIFGKTCTDVLAFLRSPKK
jgi:hypothetical protein